MDYPVHLLPKKESKIINDPVSSEVLVRRTKENIPVWDVDGELNVAVIEEKEIFTYSTNKIPPSNIDDVKINVLNRIYLAAWTEGDEPLMPNETEFEYKNELGFFLICIEDIHKFRHKYPKTIKNERETFNFEIRVVHKPLKCNYSHFEFNVYNNYDGEIITKGNGQWRKEIVHIIRDKLVKIAKFSLREIPQLYAN